MPSLWKPPLKNPMYAPVYSTLYNYYSTFTCQLPADAMTDHGEFVFVCSFMCTSLLCSASWRATWVIARIAIFVMDIIICCIVITLRFLRRLFGGGGLVFAVRCLYSKKYGIYNHNYRQRNHCHHYRWGSLRLAPNISRQNEGGREGKRVRECGRQRMHFNHKNPNSSHHTKPHPPS